MKPSRDDKIRSIIANEIDCMDMEGLIAYAENNLWEWFDGKPDTRIDSLYQAINEDYEDHKDRDSA